jgi:serine/threonine protein kinase
VDRYEGPIAQGPRRAAHMPTLGNFEIFTNKLLGAGAFGNVYEARTLQLPVKHCAAKQMKMSHGALGQSAAATPSGEPMVTTLREGGSGLELMACTLRDSHTSEPMVTTLREGGSGLEPMACTLRDSHTSEPMVTTLRVANQSVVPSQMEISRKEDIDQEVQAMQVVGGHPTVISLLGCEIVETHQEAVLAHSAWLFVELCTGGELLNLLDSGPLAEAQMRQYAWCLIDALAHCHRRGVTHRDVKLDNVLLSRSEPGRACAAVGLNPPPPSPPPSMQRAIQASLRFRACGMQR